MRPGGLTFDRVGNLYIVDWLGYRVRRIGQGGVIDSVAGDGTREYSGDGGPALQASFLDPRGVAIDAAGNLFISTGSDRIRKVSQLAAGQP
jgi:hypothetical protein